MIQFKLMHTPQTMLTSCSLFDKSKQPLVISIDKIFGMIPDVEKNQVLSEKLTVLEYLINAMKYNRRNIPVGLRILVEKFRLCYKNDDFSTIVDKNEQPLFDVNEVACFTHSHGIVTSQILC